MRPTLTYINVDSRYVESPARLSGGATVELSVVFVPLHQVDLLPFGVIQTEAERRRREAGVQQSMENGLGSCMYGFRKYLPI